MAIFQGVPVAHHENFEFWILQNAKGQKAFLHKSVVFNSKFRPSQLSTEVTVEAEVARGKQGLRVCRVLSLNGKGAIMQSGEIHWGRILNFQRGFGFVEVQGYPNIFFHVSDVKVEESFIMPGVTVKFTVAEGERGLKAVINDYRLNQDVAGLVRRQVDKHVQDGTTKVVVEVARFGEHARVFEIREDHQNGPFLERADSLADARRRIGKELQAPTPKQFGVKTNTPALSRAMKGGSGKKKTQVA